MHVQRIQFQLRIAWDENPSGWYYWTNQFYGDLDNPPETNSTLYWAAVFLNEVYSDVVQVNWVRVLDPPNTDTVVFSGPGYDQPGNYPIESGYSPYDTVLMRWLIGSKQVGYSRLRLPVQAQDQIGGKVHPDLLGYVYSVAQTNLIFGKATDKNGVPIEEFVPDDQVRMWQFRHGTTRRERLIVPNI